MKHIAGSNNQNTQKREEAWKKARGWVLEEMHDRLNRLDIRLLR